MHPLYKSFSENVIWGICINMRINKKSPGHNSEALADRKILTFFSYY